MPGPGDDLDDLPTQMTVVPPETSLSDLGDPDATWMMGPDPDDLELGWPEPSLDPEPILTRSAVGRPDERPDERVVAATLVFGLGVGLVIVSTVLVGGLAGALLVALLG